MRNETTNYGVKIRDLYFRAFDRAMQDANGQKEGPHFEKRLSIMEKYGNDAGLSSCEIEHRKQTLLYNLGQGVQK